VRSWIYPVHAATFGTGSISKTLVVLRLRACSENRASTMSALTVRMSWSHLTTTCGYISRSMQCKFDAIRTVSLHAIDAFDRSLPFRYLGRKLQAAISRVQNLLVFRLPLIIKVSDTHPNWSSPLLVKCRTSDARDAAALAIVITMTARTQKRRLPYGSVS
jgi:hypothetical protein